jgi:hypothetical protein
MGGEVVKLTAKQWEALRALDKRPCNSWEFGSTTVNVLRGRGLAESKPRSGLEITEAGRAALAAYEPTIVERDRR